jgi:hypothetical protein
LSAIDPETVETDVRCIKYEYAMKKLKAKVKLINGSIGLPTSGAAQRAMREAAPHARGVSKATLRRLGAVKTR